MEGLGRIHRIETGRIAELVEGSVRVETGSGKSLDLENTFALAFGRYVQDPLPGFILADLVVRVLVGIFLIGLDGHHFLGRKIVQGPHGGIAEKQGSVDVDVLHCFAQNGHALGRHLDTGHLLDDVYGILSLVDLHGRGMEDYRVPFD